MLIKTLEVGQLGTNCYVVSDESTLECAVIDPGAEASTILDYIEANRLKVQAIFLTHAHFDHVMALEDVQSETGAIVYVNARELDNARARDEARILNVPDLRYYVDGDEITVGALTFRVYETPGHTMGSVTLECGDALFTGDTLFHDSCGRTDLGGDMDMMLASLRRLSSLPGDYEVYPGHAESSTLENERRFNYYVRCANDNFPAQEVF
jgi:glyoxylase-like metal-dependent hydrolase (beta-lactamase superfamily II)